MINLWYSRITILHVSVLADVPERYHSGVESKLTENGYDENGDKIISVVE